MTKRGVIFRFFDQRRYLTWRVFKEHWACSKIGSKETQFLENRFSLFFFFFFRDVIIAAMFRGNAREDVNA